MVTLFLCGDVMLGRGIDQVLAHPGDPTLRENYLHDARDYVRLAEAVSGPVPAPIDPDWVWGDVLAVLDEARVDARIINLETSITTSDDFAPGKAVHYRMSPANLPALAALRPDVCALANNHVLDFGPAGLAETLDSLTALGLRTAGAGLDSEAARLPAVVPVEGGRVVVVAIGTPSSGIPADWAATEDRPGVALLSRLSDSAADDVLARVDGVRQPGDLAVVSVHWGGNWGYDVPEEHVRFAHRLVDGGVDVVHGHSAHHPRPVEQYRGRVVLYGCGDFVDDYEGIGSHKEFRDELRLAYLVSVPPELGQACELRMVPFRSRRMRLVLASTSDAEWLSNTLDRISRPFGHGVALGPNRTLLLGPPVG
ncbi:MAG: CapA family protein [Nocardioides sp.]